MAVITGAGFSIELPTLLKLVSITQGLTVIRFCLGTVEMAGHGFSTSEDCPPPVYWFMMYLSTTTGANLGFAVSVPIGLSMLAGGGLSVLLINEPGLNQ